MDSIWLYVMDNLLPLLTIVGGGIAWLVDRQQRKAALERSKSENKGTEATAMQGMQLVYDKFVEDVEEKINSLMEKIREQSVEIEALKENLKVAEKEREKLLEEIEYFRIQSRMDGELITSLKTKVDNYEKEIKLYRKELQK